MLKDGIEVTDLDLRENAEGKAEFFFPFIYLFSYLKVKKMRRMYYKTGFNRVVGFSVLIRTESAALLFS